jgi:hypothetical protein
MIAAALVGFLSSLGGALVGFTVVYRAVSGEWWWR